MKKIIILFVLALITITTNAQWETKYFVDDFGDPTNISYKAFVVKGKFSNSATINSTCLYQFIDDGESFAIYVYEYGKNPADFDGEFGIVNIKIPSGDIIQIENVFFTRETVFFSNEKYEKIINTIKNPGDYKMAFKDPGKYASSSYVLTFTIKE